METKKLKDLSFEALCGIIAKVIHSANKAYVDAIGGRIVNPTWEEAGEEQRQDLVKAVASTIVNPQTPQVSHEQWCLAKEKKGWTKDIKYDINRKTHPNMVPFDQLPMEEQFKDHLYMGIASIFCGGWNILDMPDVQAARAILQAQFANNPLPDEIDPDEVKLGVNEDTAALQEQLQATKDEIIRLGGIPEEFLNGEQDGELAAVKAAAADVAEGVMTGSPPDPIEIKDAPAEITAKEEAEEAVGEDNVGEVPEGLGPKSDLPGKTIGPPKPNIKETPAETEDGAIDTPAEDQGDKQESDSPVKTSDVQESTANGVGKSDPKGEATSEDSEKVEPAKPKAKKPAKKSSGK